MREARKENEMTSSEAENSGCSVLLIAFALIPFVLSVSFCMAQRSELVVEKEGGMQKFYIRDKAESQEK